MQARLSNIKMPLDFGLDNDAEKLRVAAAKKLGVKASSIESATLFRRSVDARKKSDVCFIASADIEISDELAAKILAKNPQAISIPKTFDNPLEPDVRISNPDSRPIVIGSGPAGLFAALTLARKGLEPLVIERGEDVDARAASIRRFNLTGELNTQSNIQFGEGGAGTYSDGKLTTQVNNPLTRVVLEEFVKAGAPEEILWQAKPHIGTDLLPGIIKAIRKEIESLGGSFLFSTQVTGISVARDGDALKVAGIEVTSADSSVSHMDASDVILAIGHSARDTYEMLEGIGLSMRQKPFSIGVRIEHLQSAIDAAQYGKSASHPALKAADYKLSCHLKSGRGVYTFCMCPGGDVVAATSEAGQVATNGMSRFARDGKNANSAVLVSVDPQDFGGKGVLAGVEFQRKWERMAFEVGGRDYKAPAQLLGDFLAGKPSNEAGSVEPTYPRGVSFGEIDEVLPKFAIDALREAFPIFGRKIAGFDAYDAVLTGIESRSSAPISMDRNETMQSNICGIFPCGEGAGHAGGIMSSAIDGIRCALALIDKAR